MCVCGVVCVHACVPLDVYGDQRVTIQSLLSTLFGAESLTALHCRTSYLACELLQMLLSLAPILPR